MKPSRSMPKLYPKNGSDFKFASIYQYFASVASLATFKQARLITGKVGRDKRMTQGSQKEQACTKWIIHANRTLNLLGGKCFKCVWNFDKFYQIKRNHSGFGLSGVYLRLFDPILITSVASLSFTSRFSSSINNIQNKSKQTHPN